MSEWKPLLEVCDVIALENFVAPGSPGGAWQMNADFSNHATMRLLIKPEFQIAVGSDTSAEFFRVCFYFSQTNIFSYTYWPFLQDGPPPNINNSSYAPFSDTTPYQQGDPPLGGSVGQVNYPPQFQSGGLFIGTGNSVFDLYDFPVQENDLVWHRYSQEVQPTSDLFVLIQKVNGEFATANDSVTDEDELPLAKPLLWFTQPNWWTQFQDSDEVEPKRNFNILREL